MTAPRPRVSEHTDAARLEALRDSMRPRVEGEEQANVEAEAWELIQALAKAGDRVRDYVGGLNRRHVETLAHLDVATAEVARLTAEVERLRGVAVNLSAAWYYGGWKYETANERAMQEQMEALGYWPTTEEQIIERRAALALPTNAQPEVPNDES